MKKMLFLFLLGVSLHSYGVESKVALKIKAVCGETNTFVSSWLIGKNEGSKFIVSWFSVDESQAILCLVEKVGNVETMLEKHKYILRKNDTFVSDTCTLNGTPNEFIFAQVASGNAGDVVGAHNAWLFNVARKKLDTIPSSGVGCTIY